MQASNKQKENGVVEAKRYATVRKNKGKVIFDVLGDYTAIDLETTGLDPKKDRIIEVCALRVRNHEIVDRFSSLINPHCDIGEIITKKTGITNEMVADKPAINEILDGYLAFIGDDVLLGHNADFDVNFIYDNCQREEKGLFSNNYMDTMSLSKKLFGEERHHRLLDLIRRFNIGDNEAHRAESDAEQTYRCYEYMLHYMENNSIDMSRFTNNSRGGLAKNIIAHTQEFNDSSIVFGTKFVFTGKLERMTRKEAMQIVADLGGIPQDGVNRETNYLVLGNNDYCPTIKDGKSGSQKKAEKMQLDGKDIDIISEDVFYDMIAVL